MQLPRNFIHYLKVLLKVEKANTQTTANEREVLKKYSRGKSVVVEIGVFEGYNTAIMANEINSSGKIFGIDPFFKGKLGLSFGKLVAQLNIKRNKLKSKVNFIEKFSDKALEDVPHEIDFVFIDGDHAYEAVRKDFEMYATKLGKDGAIAIHDARLFTNGWTRADWGPVVLVDKIIRTSGSWKVVEEVDSLVVVKKISPVLSN